VPCTWSACPLRDIFAIQPATLNRLVRNTIKENMLAACAVNQSSILFCIVNLEERFGRTYSIKSLMMHGLSRDTNLEENFVQ